MAVSNEMLAITIAIAIMFYLESKTKSRMYAMAAQIGIMLFGASLVIIGDTIPFYMMFASCLIYGAYKFFTEVGALTG